MVYAYKIVWTSTKGPKETAGFYSEGFAKKLLRESKYKGKVVKALIPPPRQGNVWTKRSHWGDKRFVTYTQRSLRAMSSMEKKYIMR